MSSRLDDFLDTWVGAERTCDATATETLLTDDFVGIGPVGFQLPKSAWLQRMTDGSLHYDELSLDERTARDYGGCVVVVGRLNAKGTARGHSVPEAVRATLVCVPHEGGWRLAAIHYSFIAGTPGAPGLPKSA